MALSRNIFEELGISIGEPQNPLETLGLSREMASHLLDQDESGGALRSVAKALFRGLASVYHPDVIQQPEKGPEFTELARAAELVTEYDKEDFKKLVRSDPIVTLGSVRREYGRAIGEVIARAGFINRIHLEAANHPLHFNGFPQTNGVLAHHDTGCFVIRPTAPESIKVVGSSKERLTDASLFGIPFSSSLEDIDDFLKNNAGLEAKPKPGDGYRLFASREGGLRIYDKNFDFLVDATEAIDEKRAYYDGLSSEGKDQISDTNSWMRDNSSNIFYITYKSRGRDTIPELVEVTRFSDNPLYMRQKNVGIDLAYKVVGTFSNEQFVTQQLYGRKSTEAAKDISGGKAKLSLPFNLGAFNGDELFKRLTGYSPLLTPNGFLCLKDPSLPDILMVTDLKVDAFLVGVKN